MPTLQQTEEMEHGNFWGFGKAKSIYLFSLQPCFNRKKDAINRRQEEILIIL